MNRKAFLQIVAAVGIAGCFGCSAERRVGARSGESAAIVVSIERQEVELVKAGAVVRRYRCSTAQAGVGSLRDSGRTPLGWHRVGAKIGDGLAAGAVLKERQWTGEVWTKGFSEKECRLEAGGTTKGASATIAGQEADGDLILSRILWLEGLEKGKNLGGDVDTRERYIYIHGTNRVEELGRPASGGCIRMDPAEVIELYEAIEEGTLVLIAG